MVNAYFIGMQWLKVWIHYNELLGSAGGKLNIQECNTIFPVTTLLYFALCFFSLVFFFPPKAWIN